MPAQILSVAAVCFRDSSSRLLTVRKRHTTSYMLPGGKLEPREAPDAAARREVEEELNITLGADALTMLGSWSAPAANEPDTEVRATVYLARDAIEPIASSEIAELRWVHPAKVAQDLVFAPLLRRHVVPALAARSRPSGLGRQVREQPTS